MNLAERITLVAMLLFIAGEAHGRSTARREYRVRRHGGRF